MRRKEDILQLAKGEKENSIEHLKDYLDKNFDIDSGNLQSEIFLEYICKYIAPYFYNMGIEDSMHMMKEKVEDLYLIMKDEK